MSNTASILSLRNVFSLSDAKPVRYLSRFASISPRVTTSVTVSSSCPMLSTSVYIDSGCVEFEMKLMEVMSREVAFTVSENVNISILSSISREKDSSCGDMRSSWTNVVLSADSGATPTTALPFISLMVVDMIEM